MAKVKMKMYVHQPPSWYGQDYWLCHSDSTSGGFICLGEVDVEFDAPEIPSNEALASEIDGAMARAREEFEARIKTLQDRREELLGGCDGGGHANG